MRQAMAEHTAIQWTEATWSPITGCSVYSPGCTHCYAMTLAGGRLRNHWSRQGLTRPSAAGPVWTGEVRFNELWLDQPLRWRKPRMVFVCAHADLFHEDVPDEWIDRVWTVMAIAHLERGHTFQVLTKRADRMRRYLTADRSTQLGRAAEALGYSGPFESLSRTAGIWLGVSCEDQKRLDERVHELLQTPAAVRWVSAEPLLGPLDFDPLRWFPTDRAFAPPPKLDWVVCGGESGPRARPCEVAWIRSIREQCKKGDVPLFVKQLGATPITHSVRWHEHGRLRALKDKKGGDPDEWPADLRVREFPR